jgi:predicted component of type VI protein secretion system
MSRYHVNHTTKIAQLADQAHEESNTIYNKRLETERADSVIFFDIFNQRFAELIVRECMEWCDAHATIDGSAQQIRDSIKKHFGVEE